ncbi:MAG: hypothetical protein Q8918_04040 [Bacteroidota bacterium]|nr:hypothetical protein [Bacteroidota bacterium]MDP4249265.1 hypothetical protein [Bacteroidota bacterium]
MLQKYGWYPELTGVVARACAVRNEPGFKKIVLSFIKYFNEKVFAAAFYSSGACTQQSWRSVKKIRTVGLSELEINQTFSIADVNKKGEPGKTPS